MKSSKTSFLRNCISGWNVRFRNIHVENPFFPTTSSPLVPVDYLVGTLALLLSCRLLRVAEEDV